jgi:hypothetical protein
MMLMQLWGRKILDQSCNDKPAEADVMAHVLQQFSRQVVQCFTPCSGVLEVASPTAPIIMAV